MLRLLLTLLSAAAIEPVYSSPWEMVMVTLASEHSTNSTWHSAWDDFRELLDEFAELQGIHFNKRNFRQIRSYNYTSFPVTTYGLRGVDCEQFRQFLSGIKAQTYHLQYASVKCGPMTFSFCMAFSCNPDDFHLGRTGSPGSPGSPSRK